MRYLLIVLIGCIRLSHEIILNLDTWNMGTLFSLSVVYKYNNLFMQRVAPAPRQRVRRGGLTGAHTLSERKKTTVALGLGFQWG